jgi:hypothetical protein
LLDSRKSGEQKQVEAKIKKVKKKNKKIKI